jgi:hypothetical protein
MTRRLFVCHATADIEATSELVDALENALNFSAGSLWTSGLPGYSAEANDMPALGAALAGSDVVLALVTQTSMLDPQFHFQLGAGWALGAHTVLLLAEPVAAEELPNALSQATIMRGHAPAQWSELIGDLSVRLGLVPRPGASTAPVITPSASKSAPPPAAAALSAPRIPAEAMLSDSALEAAAAALDDSEPAAASAPSVSPAAAAAASAAPAVDASPTPSLAPAAATASPTPAPTAEASAAPAVDASPTPSLAAVAASTASAVISTESSKRADDTPLPAAVAKIANASARPPGAATALNLAGAQIAAAKATQPPAASPAKPVSVPPLPGIAPARPASLPPLSAGAPPRALGVPPLPAAVSTNAVIVPPLPAGRVDQDSDNQDAGEPTTTPKAPIITLTSVPDSDPVLVPDSNLDSTLESDSEPFTGNDLEPEQTPQPRAAGSSLSEAPHHSYLDELRAISGDPERTAPRYSYIDELETVDPEEYAAASGYEALPSDDDDEPETREQLRLPVREESSADASEQASDSDVFARLPTCEMALEAGRAVSDCLFNRDEIDNFAPELDGPLGGLIESLGASWVELRAEQDLDTWLAVTDHLLETLPDEVRKLEEWYRVGFELATLHNLAGQLVLDGSDAAAELHWRGALERFLLRAERAEIGYENLGRVLGLLENLVGPSHERDLSNIPRSLEELRRYAAGADIHTAA